jgi:hypothetical protein
MGARRSENRSCSLDGCERPHYAHGYCNPHWRRFKRNGTPGAVTIKTPNPSECSFDGCLRTSSSRGLCASHYSQIQKGRPLTPLEERGQGRGASWVWQLRTRYKMTVQQYDEKLQQQGGGCAICGEVNASGRRLHVDHDHECCPGGTSCGQCLRGLLCSKCNVGLGQFKDSPRLMLLAIEYLASHA